MPVAWLVLSEVYKSDLIGFSPMRLVLGARRAVSTAGGIFICLQYGPANKTYL